LQLTYRWLKDYVEFDLSPQDLAAKLTMAGFEVAVLERVGAEFTGVITAKIEKVEQHPDADKLTVCTVFDGSEHLQVVCGAPNTEAGKVGAFAAVGAKLPEGKVKKIKMRGVESYGMLCSRRELGMGDDHSGLWYLPDDAPLGKPVQEVVALDDWMMELEITPNRPDALGVIGVAREVAAITGGKLKLPDVKFEDIGGEIDRHMQVVIEDADKCPRYTGILVKGVTIAPSPDWMVQRLEASGVRAINNIVDITNFVLLECNQPLHAFDYHFLDQRKIVVRRAEKDEIITTLDEQDRKLTDEDLLICDGPKPVALAGVMGGLNSLVTDETTDVFIESAYFEPTGIRRTSKRLGLSSESSYRFERGIDPEAVVYGLHRAARLMEELGGGKVVPGYIDNYPKKWQAPVIEVRPNKVTELIGVDIDTPRMVEILRSLELGVEESGDKLSVTVPAFRVDLEREVDITEEVARIYNYDDIPATLHKGVDGEGRPWRLRAFLRKLRQILVGLGLVEHNTLSFMSPEELANVDAPEGLRITNPLSKDLSVMRTSLLPHLLKAAANNRARFVPDVKIFEARSVYLPREGEQLPEEPYRLGLLLCGRRYELGWNVDEQKVDFYDLKGVVEALLDALGIEGVTWRRPEKTAPYLPGVCAEAMAGKRSLGRIGKLDAAPLDFYELDGDVFAGELDLEAIADLAVEIPIYRPVSKFPPIFRDIAVVADDEAPVDQMLEAIKQVNPKRIAEVKVFDIYTGKGVPDGKKSVAFSMRYQDILKSLSDGDADKLTAKILRVLQQRYDATLRE